MKKQIEKIININKENVFLITGNKNYISEINNIFNKFFKEKKYNNIKIINCYKVSEFDENIREILDKHEYILNTSGIHKIEEVFEDYKKAN